MDGCACYFISGNGSGMAVVVREKAMERPEGVEGHESLEARGPRALEVAGGWHGCSTGEATEGASAGRRDKLRRLNRAWAADGARGRQTAGRRP